MLEIIKHICFFVVTFYLVYAVIRISIICKKVENKLKEVSNIKEFKELYEENWEKSQFFYCYGGDFLKTRDIT